MVEDLSMAVRTNGVPDRGPAVFAVTTATLSLASLFVGSRMVSRLGIVRRWSWDDWSIVVAWLFAFGLSFAINWGTSKGLGRHDEDIAPEDRWSLRRSEYVFSILYNPALMATKTSILIFFLRLSKNTKPLLRLASYVVLGIVNLAGTILTLMNIFQCRPIYAAFEDVPYQPTCVPLLTEFICSAPVNIVTDVAILALPLPVLTSMRLPPRQKTILVLTFTLGVFATIVDVVRIYYLQQAIAFTPGSASSEQDTQFGGSPQFAWNASLSLMWSAVEVNVGITCACIPTLKPLIMRILPAMLVDPNGTRSGSSHTRDGDSVPPSVPTPKMPPFGAGGGLQAPPPSFRHNGAATYGSSLDGRLYGGPSAGGGGGNGGNVDAITGTKDYEQLMALDFLTTPDMLMTSGSPNALQAAALRRMQQQQRSSATNASLNNLNNHRPESSVYFGFVNIKQPKSVLRTSAADSWKYCTLVTILFMLWGFSYGLLNTLNNVVAVVANMTVAQTLGLTSIYFGGGYFLGPLVVGVWILRHDEHHRSRHGTIKHSQHDSIGGFKATFMLGLCIFGAGTIMFWPAAVLASFAGFMICNFVVGFGLAVLETAANPFLALCGPPAYAEMRLCLAQGIQAVGSILSGLLAQNVFFAKLENADIGSSGISGGADSMVLIDVQWTYLAVTMLCVALALFFYYIPLPEVRDEELEAAAEKLPVDPAKRNLGNMKLRTVSLVLAVVAQWTYVAAQECMSIYFRNLITSALSSPPATSTGTTSPAVKDGNSNTTDSASFNRAVDQGEQPLGMALSVPNYLVVAHTAFAASRFAAGFLAYLSVKHPLSRFIPTPRTVLTISTSLQVIFAIVFITVRPYSNPNLLSIPIILFFLAEGPGWPLIFSLGLRGQGKRTKLASAWLTMGASGPAFWPFVMYAIVTRGGSIQTAFSLVPALLCFTLVYPLYLTVVRDARILVDPPPTTTTTTKGPNIGNGADGSSTLHSPPLSPLRTSTAAGDGLGVSLTGDDASETPDINEVLASRRRSSAARSLLSRTTESSPHVSNNKTQRGGGQGLFQRLKLRGLGGSRSSGERASDDSTEKKAKLPSTATGTEMPSPAVNHSERSQSRRQNSGNDLSRILEEGQEDPASRGAPR